MVIKARPDTHCHVKMRTKRRVEPDGYLSAGMDATCSALSMFRALFRSATENYRVLHPGLVLPAPCCSCCSCCTSHRRHGTLNCYCIAFFQLRAIANSGSYQLQYPMLMRSRPSQYLESIAAAVLMERFPRSRGGSGAKFRGSCKLPTNSLQAEVRKSFYKQLDIFPLDRRTEFCSEGHRHLHIT